jgi:HD-like signal output (HDOD) protein/CheY-like chemotaxis protein
MGKILIAEDMVLLRDLLDAALRGRGHEPLIAQNGREALAIMAREKPSAVILDLGLPDVSGMVVLRHIRENVLLREVPVVVLSGQADRQTVLEVAKLGVTGYLLKGHAPLRELIEKLEAAMAAAAAHARAPASTADIKCPAPVFSTMAQTPQATDAASPLAPPTHGAEPAPGKPESHTPLLHSGAAPPIDLKSVKPIIPRSQLLERLAACEELKGFSPTVSQVLKLTQSANCSLDSIAKAIRQDQAMALKILKVANSSVYSRGDRVDTVHKAVTRIGMECIRQAILNIAVVERFSSVAFREHISTPQFWEHSIACGIIAAELAHAHEPREADAAFTAGLLHDLGRVMFAEALAEEYIRVIETARRLDVPLEQVETRMLLFNHADVMDRVLSAWKFPKHLVDPIMYHHLSVGNVRSVAPTRAGEILRLGLANRLAHAMLLGSSGNEVLYPTEEHCQAIGVASATIRTIEETARRETDDTKYGLISISHTETWPRRSEQVRALLPDHFRALYAGANPDFDAVRIFCQTLSGFNPDLPPTIIVAHIPHVRERSLVSDRVRDVERQAGVSGLPAIVLSPNGQVDLEGAAAIGRRICLLPMPVTVSRFIATVNSMLGNARQAA